MGVGGGGGGGAGGGRGAGGGPAAGWLDGLVHGGMRAALAAQDPFLGALPAVEAAQDAGSRGPFGLAEGQHVEAHQDHQEQEQGRKGGFHGHVLQAKLPGKAPKRRCRVPLNASGVPWSPTRGWAQGTPKEWVGFAGLKARRLAKASAPSTHLRRNRRRGRAPAQPRRG